MYKRHVGRPRGGDPGETRRAILDAAEGCFAASGFAGTTTRQVAARAGVNVATLHYHFGSKEELYRSVLGAVAREDVPFLAKGETPAERLSSAVEALWDFGAAHPARPRLRLFQRLSGSLFSAGLLDDRRATLLAQTLAETGVTTPLPPDETARLILALLDGALVLVEDGHGSAIASRAGVVAAALRVAGLL